MRSLFKIYIVLFMIGSGWSVYAQPTPPKPSDNGGMATPPPPPGTPIDDYVVVMALLSILYGFYVINYKLKEKTPR